MSCTSELKKDLDRLAAAPAGDWSGLGGADHFVQFYEDDGYLADSVSGFIGAGVGAGYGAVVIAMPSHLEAIEERMAAHGLDLSLLRRQGHYVALDAQETLSKFMIGTLPDERRFLEVLGDVLQQVGQRRRGVRAFGEMVAVLWEQGNSAGAIRLEQLWNELMRDHSFSLFCAYPMHGFRGESNGEPLLHICNAHSRVIPAESYSAQSSADARLRAIALLQQKASSLVVEIAERKEAELSMRLEQSKMSMAVEIAKLGIWEVDLERKHFTCSEQCKASFGVGAEESVTYDRFIGLIHPDDRDMFRRALEDSAATARECSLECRVVNGSGPVRWLAVIARPVAASSRRILGVTREITDRKLAAELLEQTVLERTSRLEETIAELESFSYSISHDLRAPLRSMQGFAEILRQECSEKLDGDARTYLQRIISSAARMDRLIQDVLTFSRAVRARLELEPVNLQRLVCGVLESYPNLQERGVQVAVEGALPPVLGNQAALTQCLSNLLGNAVKFVAPGVQPKVRIWAETISGLEQGEGGGASEAQATWVRLFVQDNGIGISREAHHKIFGIFERLNTSFEGTGIGLAVVKKAVERMGGRVGLSSELGNGSTFWIELRHAGSPLEAR